tara:strand:+ start:2819 stop:3025 length:207 start_codon:yes stop_codon:yes gene_type:complete
MYTTVDIRKLQDRLDAITTQVAEEKVEDSTPEAAPEVEQTPVENVNGDAELAELKDIMGRSGVMGLKF